MESRKNVADLQVRLGIPEDAGMIADVYLASYNIKSREQAQETYLREIREDHRFFAAFDGKKAIGFTSWYMHGVPHHGLAELNRIAVLKEYWRLGIGTRLFEAILEDAKRFYQKEGYRLRKLFLMTHDDNTQAHAFYEKMGLRKEAVLADHYYDGRDEAVYSFFV